MGSIRVDLRELTSIYEDNVVTEGLADPDKHVAFGNTLAETVGNEQALEFLKKIVASTQAKLK